MVDVVVVHGIWMHRSSRERTADEWGAALREGLGNLRSRHLDSLTVECAFYGHEYNDGKAGDRPHYTQADLEPGFETELVDAIAAGVDEDDEDGKLYLPKLVQRGLVRVANSGLFEGRDSVFIDFVKQVGRYFRDDGFRALVQEEMTKAMAYSPRVVVAHSLGSVVAFEWLRENVVADPPVLVTIGSPLGLAPVRRRVDVGWPGVRGWTNIAAGHDAVAAVKGLAPFYHSDVDDQRCSNTRAEAHHAVAYLRNVRTARAVDRALA